MKKHLFIFFTSFLLCISILYAQENTEKIIEKRLESILENSDDQIESTEYFEQLLELVNHPVSLNDPELFRLLEFKLISDQQYYSILAYRNQVGTIHDVQEIQFLKGFDQEILESILPFINATEFDARKIKISDLFSHLQQQFFIRYNQVIESKPAYEQVADTIFESSPNNHYLGSPAKLYTKYKIGNNDHFSAGFVLEKDPGEVLLKNSYPVSKNLLDNPIPLIDFSSFHVRLAQVGFIDQVVIGDYHLQFAQGLCMWSNFAFGKSSMVNSTKRFAADVIPSISAIENNFFRGAALSLNFGPLDVSLFYSNKNRDANMITRDQNGQLLTISALQNTGLHRTINELNDRNVLNEKIFGGRFSVRMGRFELGTTAYTSKWNALLLPIGQLYKKFDFSGNQNSNLGFDYQGFFNKIGIYGEWGLSQNGGMAYLCGFDFYPDSYTKLNLLYRNYQPEYQNLYANAMAENSSPKNKKGLYLGFNSSFLPKWQLSFYIDIFYFEWMKSQVDSPSHGIDYFSQIDYRESENFQFYLRYKRKNKQSNSSVPNWMHLLEEEIKDNIRLDFTYAPLPNFQFKSRLEWVKYQTLSSQTETGLLLFQQLRYSHPNKPFNLYFRLANFNTDGFYSRIYTYENDLLYAFSIPAFYDKGNHFYLLINHSINKNITFWLKFGQTVYQQKSIIGTGPEMIDGSSKSELKFQLRVKL